MKIIRCILSVMLVAVLAISNIPVNAGPEDELITLTINGNLSSANTDKVYDGEKLAPVQFADTIIGGVQPGDEVHLVADQEFEIKDVDGSRLQNVTLSGFKLEGKDKDKYALPTITAPVAKQAKITPRIIKVYPKKPYIYYGQEKPTRISDPDQIGYDDTSIIAGDTFNITTVSLNIQNGSNIGDYNITLNSINVDNPNYKAELDSQVKFAVREYVTAAIASPDNTTGEYVGVTTEKLSAPTGFLISTTGAFGAGNWHSFITINLAETQTGAEPYYLRNDDAGDTEYYQAISGQKTFNYKSVQSKPTIQSVKLEKVNANAALNFSGSGVFGNDSVNITITARGAAVAQSTTIYLGEEGEYASRTTSSELKDGVYYYTAVFNFNVPAGTDYYLSKNLRAYAQNSSGEGNKVNVKFTDGEGREWSTNHLVLDNVKPDANLTKIDGNYQNNAIKAEVTIADTGSGVAKVEYMWDTEFKLNGATKTDYVEFNGYSSGETDYEFVLPWSDSIRVAGNRHTLHLRVTDKAGNVRSSSFADTTGSDMLEPNIVSVELRKAPGTTINAILRFLSFGSFANEAVEIAVVANDNEDGATYASGVDTVTLNGRQMTKNAANEYVLTMLPDDEMNIMRITATDGKGFTKTVAVTDVPNTLGIIRSDRFIVENNAPTVDLDFSSAGYTDGFNNVWYGENEKTDTIEITSEDKSGTIRSGLYSIKISDNGVSIFSKEDFTSVELEHFKSFDIEDFAEGRHELTVVVEDNAGNSYTESKVFYTDYTPPNKGEVAASRPVSVEIDGNKWFDKDEVIEFRVDAADAGSGLDSISLMINDEEFNFSRSQINTDAQGSYVLVDTQNLAPDGEHKYTVTGSVTDIANNTLTFASLTVYKDFENPVIEKFTVEKKNGLLRNILNVLSFGVFFNDALVFKAHVSDADFDSGVDYVSVSHNGLAAPERMVDEGNGVFSMEIPLGTNVFASNIIVTAYDKYGKSSVTCPGIESAEQGGGASDGTFVMIETIKPLIDLSMPAGDGVSRRDGQRWYKSNKSITFTTKDGDSGIQNIEFKVNGVSISEDKNDTVLLNAVDTAAATDRDIDEHRYVFDVDYFISQVGEPSDGKYVIDIEVVDNAGNSNTLNVVYYVDKIAPTIDKVEFTPATSDGVRETTEFISSLEYGHYFKTGFSAIINVSDVSPSSGIDKVGYRFVSYQNGKKTAGKSGTQKVVSGKALINVPKGFKGQIFVEVSDNAGNKSHEKTTKAFVVDNAAPKIEITNKSTTRYKDASGNKLYVSNTGFTVTVSDYVSGIKEIGYVKAAEKDPFAKKTISINNTGYKVGGKLADGWTIVEMDANLVTKATKTFSFNSDDNDIMLTFDATDRSANKKQSVRSDKFTVDKTRPVINVRFRSDEDGDLYYNANRVADITVTERNFDPNLIKAAITNRFGRVPRLSFSTRSKTEHVAVITFDEGDYTFDMSGSDLGNHTAMVNFSGGNEKMFYVDKTKPAIVENFATFSKSSTQNSFNTDKTVQIRVTEHNFDPKLINLRIMRKGAGQTHNSGGFSNVTNEVLSGARWSNSGDVHTISFTLGRDAVYQVAIAPSDLAGNVSDNRSTTVFEIDKTVPKLKNPADRTAYVYKKPASQEAAAVITFEDNNTKEVSYSITAYNFNKKANGAYEFLVERSVQSKVNSDKVDLPSSYFNKDGIYEIKATAYDIAGNSSGEKVYTYVVMRNTAMMAYIPEEDLLKFNNTGTRALDFSDIRVYVYVVNDSGFTLRIGETLLDDSDYTILSEKEIANQVKEYTLAVPQNYISSMFSENNQVFDMPINVMNGDGQIITLGRMVIDNVKPFGEFELGLANGAGYYNTDSKAIQVIKLSDDIDKAKTTVNVDGKDIPFTYDADNKIMSFTLDKNPGFGHPWAGHEVKVTLVDTAGNEYSLFEVKNVYVGSWFLRFWIFFAGGAAIIACIVLLIWKPWRKRRA